ncbi:hypothetical protein ABLB84_08310 [Xenorhabdus szentirmaii]
MRSAPFTSERVMRYALLETIEGADCLWILEASMAEWLQEPANK